MREDKRGRLRKALGTAGVGMAVAYFFDRQMGRARRAKARDRAVAATRKGRRRLSRLARSTRARAYGAWMKRTHPADQSKDLDDNTLARKLESEALTGTAVPEGIKVNVEDGVVVLRGEVDSPDRMSELAETVMEVPGVAGVENLLHLPGEPAPNKAAALEASARATDTT